MLVATQLTFFNRSCDHDSWCTQVTSTYMFLEHDENKYMFKIIFICNLNKKTISTIGCGTPTSLLIEASLLPDVRRNNYFLHILFVTSVVIPQTDSNYSCWATSNLVPRGYVERGLLHFTWLLAMFRNAGDSDSVSEWLPSASPKPETIRFSKATVQIQQFKDER